VCMSVGMDDTVFEFGPTMVVEQVSLGGYAGAILRVYAVQPVTAVPHENLGLDAVDAFDRGAEEKIGAAIDLTHPHGILENLEQLRLGGTIGGEFGQQALLFEQLLALLGHGRAHQQEQHAGGDSDEAPAFPGLYQDVAVVVADE